MKYHELTEKIWKETPRFNYTKEEYEELIREWLEERAKDLWAMHKTTGVIADDFWRCLGLEQEKEQELREALEWFVNEHERAVRKGYEVTEIIIGRCLKNAKSLLKKLNKDS